jgi:hypothetical protein
MKGLHHRRNPLVEKNHGKTIVGQRPTLFSVGLGVAQPVITHPIFYKQAWAVPMKND